MEYDYGVLPPWVTELRPHQIDAVQRVCAAYDRGCGLVMLDAPTGSGKTLIGELVRRRLGCRANYVCSTRTLQDQFLRDFPDSRVLKGRSNYPTMFGGLTAAECQKAKGADGEKHCPWCDPVWECRYELAKRDAMIADVAVLNTAYMLAEFNYVGRLAGRQLTIVDECDTLEDDLMRFATYHVGRRVLKELDMAAPIKGARKTTISTWMTEFEGRLQEAIRELRPKQDAESVQRMTSYMRLVRDTGFMQQQMVLGGDNFIRDNDAGPLVMKPITVEAWGGTYIWRHSPRWLLMSATIISPEDMVRSLGYEGEWDVVSVPMTFSRARRKVIAAPVADMANKHKEASWPKMATALRGVLRRHEDQRILVHTVSYDLAQYLNRELRSGRTVTYGSGGMRDVALQEFRDVPGAVLLAPSMDRGVDLVGDDCRVVVVAKVPFPNLGDPQVSARLHTVNGQTWYAVQTVRTLVQMTGRATRSRNDWSVTYVLDRQFTSNVLRNSRHLLPAWWKEALDTQFPVKELLV